MDTVLPRSLILFVESHLFYFYFEDEEGNHRILRFVQDVQARHVPALTKCIVVSHL
jgi:hypothetical protein